MAKKKTPVSAPKNGTTGPLKDLKELYEFMQTSNLQTVELDKKDFHVKLIRRGSGVVPMPVPVAMGGPVSQMAAPVATSSAPAAVVSATPANAVTIKSPMMGIFYRSSSPSSPPFAKEGEIVQKGDVVCLIEAMKVFNDIKAEEGGKVLKVCIENGKSVKVGQDLFILERA